MYPAEGAWPPPHRELLIERASLPLIGAAIGDTVTIRLTNETQRRMRIAGVVATPNLPTAALTNQTYAFMTFESLEWLDQPQFYTGLDITVTGDRFDKQHIEAVAALVRSKIESSGRAVYFTYLPGTRTASGVSGVATVILAAWFPGRALVVRQRLSGR